MFECRLKSAIRGVGCVPWDYPMPPSMNFKGSEEFCNSRFDQNGSPDNSTLSRFDAFMNSGESISNCECLSDCEEVVYETQVIIDYKISLTW